MRPHLESVDEALFSQYLRRAAVYFEYGSGGSTVFAHTFANIRHIYSLESDASWYRNVAQQCADSARLTYFFQEMDTRERTWGAPGPDSTEQQRVAYSDAIYRVPAQERRQIDLVMIDGRFRVASCLKCFDALSDACAICFDDFLNRPCYHIVLQYFDIVEQANARMVVLKKKPGVTAVPPDLIRHYEQDPR